MELLSGAIATELDRHMDEKYPGFWIIKPIFVFFVKTPWHGAQTSLYCCLEDSIENESGLYYSDCAKKTPSKAAQDMDAAKRLWEVSENMVNLSTKKHN